MRIIIIRHAEPDYEHNTITPKGFVEAHYLAQRLIKENIDEIYCSPLGRALDTAKEYLQLSKKDAKVIDIFQEFGYPINEKVNKSSRISWDFLPSYLAEHKEMYDNSRYFENEIFQNCEIKDKYKEVCTALDDILKQNGYERKDNYYQVNDGNKKTICIFCHLGVESVMLSHLLNIPYVILAQAIGFTPSSVSVLYTEEREQGIAQFRAQCLGDISHLNANNEKPSYMGRFKENFTDPGDR